jgi:TetR/AcrR family transcriptional regulator, transcriptional repressor for nem operon
VESETQPPGCKDAVPLHKLTPRGRRTRERIIEHAAKIFNQRGFEGGALSELLKATGLGKGGIYRHFSGKEELAEEAFRFAWKRAMARRNAGLEECATGEERLRKMIGNFIHGTLLTVPGGCVMMNTTIDADDTNPHLLALVRLAFQEWQSAIEKTIVAGQQSGEFGGEHDPSVFARRIIGSLEGAMLITRIEGNRAALHEVQEPLNALVSSLVVRKSARREI